jgi:hypothetical protein
MFAVGWGTVVVVQGNIFAYLYANFLVVCGVRNSICRGQVEIESLWFSG